MNWLKLLSAFILCCLGGTTVKAFAQSRPLRITEHHASEADVEAAAKAQTAAQTTAQDADANAKTAATKAQAAARAATQAEEARAQSAQPAAAAAAQAKAAAALVEAQSAATEASVAQAKAQLAHAQLVVAQAAVAAALQSGGATGGTLSGSRCWLAPASHCYSSNDPIKGVNDFYGTAKNYSYISQVKSIYNGASGATTISANIAALNFPFGPQFIFGTNIQAGATVPATVTTGSTPTLTPASAALATQNMIYGGTFDAAVLFPLIYHGLASANSPGGVIFSVDAIATGGVDIQNFKSGTSTTVRNPPTHSNVGLESYLQFNSANLADATSDILGDIFVGGRYGYNYASHGYARDYGFGTRVSSGVGQLVFGVMLSKIASISISRGFGPSQVYIDSTVTNPNPTKINNFKAWSFGITYQAPAKAPAS